MDEIYGIESREIVFEDGKPILIDGGKHFSISHSEELIALAFYDTNCGVDIEKIKLREFKKISERMKFEAETKNKLKRYAAIYEKYKRAGGELTPEMIDNIMFYQM